MFVSNTAIAKNVGGGISQRRTTTSPTRRVHGLPQTLADLYFTDELSRLAEDGAAAEIAPLWLLQRELRRQATGQGQRRMQISQGLSRGAANAAAAPASMPVSEVGKRNSLPPPPPVEEEGSVGSFSSSSRSEASASAKGSSAGANDFYLSSADSEEFEAMAALGKTGLEPLIFTDAAHLALTAAKGMPSSSSAISLPSMMKAEQHQQHLPTTNRFPSLDQARSDLPRSYDQVAMGASNPKGDYVPRRPRSCSPCCRRCSV